MYYCQEGKCYGNLGIEEGGKCIPDDDYDDEFKYLFASMQCKEGLGCVPDSRDEDSWSCKKVTTKKNTVSCENGDDECPLDSYCACDDEKGAMQCIPIPTSSKKFTKRIEEYYHDFYGCMDGVSLTDIDDYVNALMCLYSTSSDLYEYFGKEYLHYDSEYRCADYSLLPSAASSTKISVVAIMAAILFALF